MEPNNTLKARQLRRQLAQAQDLRAQIQQLGSSASWQMRNQAAQLIRQIEAELMLAERPIEPPNGSIVEFDITFVPGGTVYSYVCSRRHHLWYVSQSKARFGNACQWAELWSKFSTDGKQIRDYRVVRVGSATSTSSSTPTEPFEIRTDNIDRDSADLVETFDGTLEAAPIRPIPNFEIVITDSTGDVERTAALSSWDDAAPEWATRITRQLFGLDPSADAD